MEGEEGLLLERSEELNLCDGLSIISVSSSSPADEKLKNSVNQVVISCIPILTWNYGKYYMDQCSTNKQIKWKFISPAEKTTWIWLFYCLLSATCLFLSVWGLTPLLAFQWCHNQCFPQIFQRGIIRCYICIHWTCDLIKRQSTNFTIQQTV